MSSLNANMSFSYSPPRSVRHVSIISNNVQSNTTFSWYNLFIDLGLHVSIL